MKNPYDRESGAIDLAYDRLRASEVLLAKVLKVPELAQMARSEQRLREYVDRKWELRRVQASVRARNLTASGQSAKQIAAGVRKVMGQWPKDVTPRFKKDTAEVYKLARIVGSKKAQKKTKAPLVFDTPNFTEDEEPVEKAKAFVAPTFDLADEAAIAALEGNNVFWIGEHYDTNLAASISATTSETIAQAGASRATAAALMAERVRATLGAVLTPGGFHGSSLQYFEGLTANAMTVARTFGQIRSFEDIGIARYQIVNPLDSRTCPVCNHMDGKVFEQSQGNAQMEAEVEASTPEDIKRIHPWYTPTQLRAISSKPGQLKGAAGAADSKALAAAGFSLPPFHFRCRCAVDIDEAVGSFSALAA